MKPDFIIIGLTGPAGAGKDTVADYLCETHDFVRYSFAEPMRDMLEAMLAACDIDYAYLFERSLKEQPIPGLDVSARHMMQTLGTEWGRALHPDWWVRIAARHLGLPLAPVHDRIVLSDVRFGNEAQMIRSHGGSIVRVQRDTLAVRAHVSETTLAGIEADHLIDNTGSIARLHGHTDDLLDSLLCSWRLARAEQRA